MRTNPAARSTATRVPIGAVVVVHRWTYRSGRIGIVRAFVTATSSRAALRYRIEMIDGSSPRSGTRVFRDLTGKQFRLELTCERCGCSDSHACPSGCWWISHDPPRCSNCAR